MCYPVCGMVDIKVPLLLIEKSSPCSEDSGFPLSLTEWSLTIYPMPYNRIINVLSVLLNKAFPSFFSSEHKRHGVYGATRMAGGDELLHSHLQTL